MAQVIRTVREMNSASKAQQVKGRSIAAVPTMGALHEGHRVLMRQARSISDVVVTTIFVNPLQFGAGEDYERYPRTLEEDVAVCAQEDVDIVFAPPVEQMYRPDDSTFVVEESLGSTLEGASRPGHFRGVTTIVAKLLNIVEPDVVMFGQKDYQQLCVVRRMIRDLDFPVELVMVPTVRDPDGVAISSRNRYLSDAERRSARVLYQALADACRRIRAGVLDTAEIIAGMRTLLEQTPQVRTDYVALVDSASLAPLPQVAPGKTAILIAAYVGATRLIDNVLVES